MKADSGQTRRNTKGSHAGGNRSLALADDRALCIEDGGKAEQRRRDPDADLFVQNGKFSLHVACLQ